MTRKTEKPKVTPAPRPGSPDNERVAHPAFGVVTLSRTTGGSTRLFQSDHVHQHCMLIGVHYAEVDRHLNQDWVHPSGQIVQIALSEAQFARFVSSVNAGGGVPCTLEFVAGKGNVPAIADVEPKVALFDRELQKTFDDLAETVAAQLKALDDPMSKVPPKTRQPIREAFEKIQRELSANMPFIQQQFHRHIEKVAESGKQEVEAYVQQRMGELQHEMRRLERLREGVDEQKLIEGDKS